MSKAVVATFVFFGWLAFGGFALMAERNDGPHGREGGDKGWKFGYPPDDSPESVALRALADANSGPSPETIKDMAASRQAVLDTYRGSTIHPAREAIGATLAMQQTVAAAFAAKNPVPAQRMARFAWCERDHQCTILGWGGQFVSATRKGGDWIVEVIVCPRLTRTTYNITSTSDRSIERWKYTAGGQLEYLDARDPKDNLAALIGD